ncbi:MAG: hypothetical protein M3014_10400 [Chloroflexota bacterium]|nr:hypothetical protein [Chloroflexota bacterium]
MDREGHLWTLLVRWGVGIILAACAVALLVTLSHLVGDWTAWLQYPFPRPGSEGLILYESLLVKHGGSPYAPITPQQFISGPYPPVYYWLAAATLPDRLPDFSQVGHISSLFMAGRLISLMAAFIAAVLMVPLAIFEGGYNRLGRRASLIAGLGGLFAGGLFLTLPEVTVWATRFRGDMLMIALTAAGLTCTAIATRGAEQARWAWLIAAAAFFTLAFFTKQTALAGPIAAGVYLLLREPRVGLKWVGLMGLFVLLPFGALDLLTGQWFYLKMVTYHSLPLRSLTLWRLLQFGLWEDQWPLVVASLSFAIVRLSFLAKAAKERSPGWQKRTTTLAPIFLLATIATLPTGAIVGADHNHLLMSGLALGFVMASLLARLLVELGQRVIDRWFFIAAPAAAALVALYLLVTAQPSSFYNPDLQMPRPEVAEQLRKIVLNISLNPGKLFFADDPGLLALAGKETPYDDPFTMTALAQEGRWDEQTYRDMLRQGSFSLLVLSCAVYETPTHCRADVFTPGVLDAIRSGYKLLYEDVLITYKPK